MTKKTTWQEPAPSELELKLQGIVEPIVRSEGLFLLELELVGAGAGRILRLYVDSPGGVSLEDCARVSRQAGDVLDVEDLIDRRYRLEVSSPGLDRKLKYAREFELFAGRQARLLVRGPENNYYLRGRLKGRQHDEILIQAEGRITAVALDDIIRARLEPELSGEQPVSK